MEKLNPDYTFESFIVGDSNQYAYSVSRMAADYPGRWCNLIYIYGDVGMGKSHLMQAIGNHIANKNPTGIICKTTCERFSNEHINAIQNGKITELRKKYRQVDLLLVDDIQFLSGKTRLQKEFFHTFNALFGDHKLIVLTSDCSPSAMKEMPALISRFGWGQVVQLGKPCLATRIAILQKMTKKQGIKLESSDIRFIAERITSNIRSLETAVFRINAARQFAENKLILNRLEISDLLKGI
jgi:chromosomal replication initiator protein